MNNITISSISDLTKIPENSLYRWKNGRHLPNEESINKLKKAGVCPIPFVKPYLERVGIEIERLK